MSFLGRVRGARVRLARTATRLAAIALPAPLPEPAAPTVVAPVLSIVEAELARMFGLDAATATPLEVFRAAGRREDQHRALEAKLAQAAAQLEFERLKGEQIQLALDQAHAHQRDVDAATDAALRAAALRMGARA